jgi:L,D-transpeptidase YcbB
MRSKHLVAFLAGSAMALVLASGAATNAAPKKTTASKATTSKPEKLAQQVPAQSDTANSATPTQPAPDPTTINGKLREILTSSSRGDRFLSRKGERQAVDAFYQKNNNYEPLWVSDGKPSSKAEAVLAYIKTITADGLEPADYVFPNFAATSLDGQAETEMKFTAVLLTYARHAMNGRVHWSRLTSWVFYKENYDAADVLTRIADTSNVASELESINPQQPEYKALKTKLVDLRGHQPEAPAARIPYGPYLKYGTAKASNDKAKNAKDKSKTAKDKEKPADEPVAMMQDPRVPMLREKLGLTAKNDTYYDKELAEAAAKFQDGHGLKADGEIGNPTIDAINGPNRDSKVNIVLANMERWRWAPRDLGKTHVVLNIPEFTLRVWNDGAVVWTTRVVVGKVGHETPLLSETMKFITVNPTWNVPQSIVYNELLPIYETSNPGIFAQQGLKVEQGKDGIRVYQPPGDRNALGRVRFNFPNKFLVYQHDTPEKHLFAKETRAYSHGCMRVQDPVKYAEVMLTYGVPKEKYTQERIRRMYGDSEINIDFAVQIPVHVMYQTAFVDDAGVLQFRDDVYGYDSKMVQLMKGSERKVADMAIDRPADPNYRPSPTDFARLDNVPRDGGSSGYSGRGGGDPFGGLFGRIFR